MGLGMEEVYVGGDVVGGVGLYKSRKDGYQTKEERRERSKRDSARTTLTNPHQNPRHHFRLNTRLNYSRRGLGLTIILYRKPILALMALGEFVNRNNDADGLEAEIFLPPALNRFDSS
jgi:hypothetical protein